MLASLETPLLQGSVCPPSLGDITAHDCTWKGLEFVMSAAVETVHFFYIEISSNNFVYGNELTFEVTNSYIFIHRALFKSVFYLIQ